MKSTAYGKDAKVTLDVISEGAAGTFKAKASSSRATGTDIAATINGINANGKGNALSINTAALSLSLTVTDGSSKSFKFDVSGGGAQFQLGPTVNGSQQARLHRVLPVLWTKLSRRLQVFAVDWVRSNERPWTATRFRSTIRSST